MPKTLIRPATPDDAETIVDLVKALAIYEKEPLSTVKITPDDVRRDGFGAGLHSPQHRHAPGLPLTAPAGGARTLPRA